MTLTRLPTLRPGQSPPGPLLGGRQPGHHPAPAHPLRLRGQRARTRAPAPAAGGGASASSGPSQLGARLKSRFKPASCRPGPDTTVYLTPPAPFPSPALLSLIYVSVCWIGGWLPGPPCLQRSTAVRPSQGLWCRLGGPGGRTGVTASSIL